jgi:hypothetical protein
MPSLIEIGLLDLEKKIFKNYSFVIISPWRRAIPNLESPPPKDDLCQIWLKLA